MLFLKKFIDDGKLGELVGIQCSATYAKPDSYFTGWHTTTGPLLLNTIHDVDDFHYFTGKKSDSGVCGCTKYYTSWQN